MPTYFEIQEATQAQLQSLSAAMEKVRAAEQQRAEEGRIANQVTMQSPFVSTPTGNPIIADPTAASGQTHTATASAPQASPTQPEKTGVPIAPWLLVLFLLIVIIRKMVS